MTQKASVVTPQRFASGFTYKDYVAQVKANKDKFEEYYKTGQLSADDADFFRRAARSANGIGKMLVLSEDWSPDCFREVPVMARIVEAAGIEMRIFARDQNLDIMNEFLNQGKFQSIPVAVFYTKDLRYICHWIERPESATRERLEIDAEILKTKPNIEQKEMRAIRGERTRPMYPAWQQVSIREIRKMLSEKLGIK